MTKTRDASEITIRELIARLKAKGQSHLETHIAMEKRKRPRINDEIKLAAFLAGIKVKGIDEGSPILSLDTTLSAPMQELQVLRDLSTAIKKIEPEKIDQTFQEDIFKILQQYPPFQAQLKTKDPIPLHLCLKVLIPQMAKVNQEAMRAHADHPKHKKMEDMVFKNVRNEEEGKVVMAGKRVEAGERARKKHLYGWELRPITEKDKALPILLGLEISRFISPDQPKNRIVKNASGDMFLASQKDPRVMSLPLVERAELKSKINKGKYTGLGAIAVTALILYDMKLREKDLGLNVETNKVTRISGEAFTDRTGHHITPQDIYLPFIEDNLDKRDRLIENELLLANPVFRAEINETILKYLLIPAIMVENLFSSFSDDVVERRSLQKSFVQTIENLRHAALQNTSFQEFVQSKPGQKHYEKCLHEFIDFKVQNKQTLGMPNELTSVIRGKFSRLQEAVKQNKQEAVLEKQNAKTVLPPIQRKKVVFALVNPHSHPQALFTKRNDNGDETLRKNQKDVVAEKQPLGTLPAIKKSSRR